MVDILLARDGREADHLGIEAVYKARRPAERTRGHALPGVIAGLAHLGRCLQGALLVVRHRHRYQVKGIGIRDTWHRRLRLRLGDEIEIRSRLRVDHVAEAARHGTLHGAVRRCMERHRRDAVLRAGGHRSIAVGAQLERERIAHVPAGKRLLHRERGAAWHLDRRRLVYVGEHGLLGHVALHGAGSAYGGFLDEARRHILLGFAQLEPRAGGQAVHLGGLAVAQDQRSTVAYEQIVVIDAHALAVHLLEHRDREGSRKRLAGSVGQLEPDLEFEFVHGRNRSGAVDLLGRAGHAVGNIGVLGHGQRRHALVLDDHAGRAGIQPGDIPALQILPIRHAVARRILVGGARTICRVLADPAHRQALVDRIGDHAVRRRRRMRTPVGTVVQHRIGSAVLEPDIVIRVLVLGPCDRDAAIGVHHGLIGARGAARSDHVVERHVDIVFRGELRHGIHQRPHAHQSSDAIARDARIGMNAGTVDEHAHRLILLAMTSGGLHLH